MVLVGHYSVAAQPQTNAKFFPRPAPAPAPKPSPAPKKPSPAPKEPSPAPKEPSPAPKASHLDCYWATRSLDFRLFWKNQVGFSTKPPKRHFFLQGGQQQPRHLRKPSPETPQRLPTRPQADRAGGFDLTGRKRSLRNAVTPGARRLTLPIRRLRGVHISAKVTLMTPY